MSMLLLLGKQKQPEGRCYATQQMHSPPFIALLPFRANSDVATLDYTTTNGNDQCG